MTLPLEAVWPRRPRGVAAVALMLHLPGDAALAAALARAWTPTNPCAAIMPVAAHAVAGAAQICDTLTRYDLRPNQAVLVGFGGAAALAFTHALAQDKPGFAGLLMCGTSLAGASPPQEARGARPLALPKLRLIWLVDDTLASARLLGERMRDLRRSLADVQGAVLLQSPAEDSVEAGEAMGGGSAIMRLGAAYLAELLAGALSSCTNDMTRCSSFTGEGGELERY